MKLVSKRRRWVVLAAAAAFVLGGRVQAAEKLTVRLDFSPVGQHAAMHLAKVKGWFEREGLDIDLQDGTGSLNTIQLVASGQIDVGQVQLGSMAIARSKGLPVTSFAGFMRKGDLAVMVPRDSHIDTLQDLKGKKLLCFTASPWAPFIDPFLAKGGLDRKTVDVEMVSPPAMGALYSKGDADGFLSVEPYAVPLVEKTRPAKTIRLADYGISFPSYGFMTTDDTLKKRKETLAKLVKVEIETWEYIWNGHVAEAVRAIMQDRPGINLDPEILTPQLELSRPFFDTDATKGKRIGWQAEEDWVAALNSMKDAGAIPSANQPEQYYTNALIPQ